MKSSRTKFSSSRQQLLLSSLAAGALTTMPVTALADAWEFSITPYFYAADMEVTTTVGSIKSEVELDSDEVLEKFENGFMAMTTARNGKWVLALDATYFKLGDGQSTSVSGPFGRETATGAVGLTSRQWIYQPMVGYQVLDDGLQVDLYGGLRYTRLRMNLDIDIDTSIPAFPGGERTFKTELEWTDAVVGGHFFLPLNDQWSLTGLIDVGAGENSDQSYQILGAIRWQFHDAMAASLGYRVLDQQHEEGNVEYEATFDGVILGMAFDF